MYKIFLTIQCICIILFAVVFIASYVCKDYVRSLANEFVCQEIEPGMSTTVHFIKTHLDNPLLAHITSYKIELVIREIVQYENAPLPYIMNVSARFRHPDTKVSELADSAINQKIGQKIQRMYADVFDKILLDLRIFSGSNIAAFFLSLLLLWRGTVDQRTLIIPSVILCFATIYCVSVYINQNWFFTILFDSYYGYTYSFLLAFTYGKIYLKWKGSQKTPK